mgnify:CR=1 FL=1
MIIKYGKAVDMKKLNRDLDAIRENIEIARTDSERFYCVSDCKFPPQCRICGGGQSILYRYIRDMIITNVMNAELCFFKIYPILKNVLR